MAPTRHHDHCCNPFSLENHKKAKELRHPSLRIREKWNLSEQDFLCVTCRLLCSKREPGANVSPNDPNSHGVDDGLAGSSKDQSLEVSSFSHRNVHDNQRTLRISPDIESIDDFIKPLDDFGIEAAELLTQTSKLSQLSINRESETSATLTPTQNSKFSELSIDTLLPTINDGLAKLDQSPIPRRKLGVGSWLREKVKRVSRNLKRLLGVVDGTELDTEIEDPDLRNIINRLKAKFHSEGISRAEKIQILTILPSQWSTAEISRIMGARKYMVKKAKKISEDKGILSMPDAKFGRALLKSTIILVEQFYNDDRVSTNMPGMKDFVSCRNSKNERIHVQKRLVHSNLKEVFVFFRDEHPSVVIGFSSFASLRPEHCVLVGDSGTHTVCVCPIHQNVKLMILGANFRRITKNSNHPLDHYNDCLRMIVCCNPSSSCHLGECESCPGTSVLNTTLNRLMEEANIDTITYKNWIFTPRAKLETLTKSTTEFIEDFCEKIKNLSPHAFISKQQSSFMKERKELLQDNEFLVVCDFAENYAFVVQDAVPGFHWNNDSATVYPVVIYFKDDDVIAHKSLVIISDCLSHDTVAVYTFTKIVINFIGGINENATKIFYFSDGAPQQYKNLNNFINLYYHEEDFGIKAEWHYFPTAHGKGPCDGIGGTVKRQAARASLQLPPDEQITTPEQLYDWASEPTHLPSITVRYSSRNDYDEMKTFLQTRFATAKAIPGTHQIHCIIPDTDGYLLVKRFSRSEEFERPRVIKMPRKKTTIIKKPARNSTNGQKSTKVPINRQKMTKK